MRRSRYDNMIPYKRYKSVTPTEIRIPIAPEGDPDTDPLVLPDDDRDEGDLWGKELDALGEYRKALATATKLNLGDIIDTLQRTFTYDKWLDKKTDAELANGMQITVDALSTFNIASRYLGKAYAYYAEFSDWLDSYEELMPTIWKHVPALPATVDQLKKESQKFVPNKGIEKSLVNIPNNLQETYDAFKEQMEIEPEE